MAVVYKPEGVREQKRFKVSHKSVGYLRSHTMDCYPPGSYSAAKKTVRWEERNRREMNKSGWFKESGNEEGEKVKNLFNKSVVTWSARGMNGKGSWGEVWLTTEKHQTSCGKRNKCVMMILFKHAEPFYAPNMWLCNDNMNPLGSSFNSDKIEMVLCFKSNLGECNN